MPSRWETLRASATACGPQHLSSARLTQSCGQSLRVMPTTSYPCSSSNAAAAEESTPPLMPTTTRSFLFSVTGLKHTGGERGCKGSEPHGKDVALRCPALTPKGFRHSAQGCE